MFLHSLVETLLVHHVLSEDVNGFKRVHLILVFLYQLSVSVIQTQIVKKGRLEKCLIYRRIRATYAFHYYHYSK